MGSMKWIKLSTDLFDDKRIRIIEKSEYGTEIILLWIKLMCLAGQENNSGIFMLTDSVPYTADTFSAVTNIEKHIVEIGLSKFHELGMLDKTDGVYVIPDWRATQNLEKYDKKREYDREYKKAKREEQRKIMEEQQLKNNDTTAEIERVVEESCTTEERLNNDSETTQERVVDESVQFCSYSKYNSKSVSKSNSNSSNIYNNIMQLYNEILGGKLPTLRTLGDTRIKKIKKIEKTVIENGGWEELFKAVAESDFLLYGSNSWAGATFDWIIESDHAQKILGGNYRNRTIQKTSNDESHKWFQPGDEDVLPF